MIADKVLNGQMQTINKVLEEFYVERRVIENLFINGIISKSEKDNFMTQLITYIRLSLKLPVTPDDERLKIIQKINEKIKGKDFSVTFEREEPELFCYGETLISKKQYIFIEIDDPQLWEDK